MSRGVDTALGIVRTRVFTAPVLLLVFAVVRPLAGFPWCPLIVVLALAVMPSLLGFGYCWAGKRGPVLLVTLLLVTTVSRTRSGRRYPLGSSAASSPSMAPSMAPKKLMFSE